VPVRTSAAPLSLLLPHFTSLYPLALPAQHDNTIWTAPGSKGITECGSSLQQWQAQGGDPGTTVAAWPADSVVLDLAKQLLGLQ
jgi:hypothetical protein